MPLDDEIPYVEKEDNDLFRELQKLPKKYIAVVHLYYYEDVSIDEISTAIGISPSAVKMRLMRARNILKDVLKEEDYV